MEKWLGQWVGGGRLMDTLVPNDVPGNMYFSDAGSERDKYLPFLPPSPHSSSSFFSSYFMKSIFFSKRM